MRQFSEKLGNEGDIVPNTVEQYQLGQLQLCALPLEHSGANQTVKINGQIVTLVEAAAHLVARTDATLMEYSPTEIRKYSPIKPKSKLSYFGPFQNESIIQSKPVYVLDPAYDPTFVILSGFGELPAGIIMTTAAYLKHDKSISRRRFMRMAFAVGAGITGYGLANVISLKTEYDDHLPNEHIVNEAHFRRTVISRGLLNLSKSPEMASKSLLVLYPNVHWEGIKRLLENPERVEEDFLLYRTMYPLDRWYVERKYEGGTSQYMNLASQRLIR